VKSQFDAILVGGGIVGVAMALMLASHQKKVLLLEKLPPMEHVPDNYSAKTLALSYSSLHILTSLGVNLPYHCDIQDVIVTMQGRFGSSALSAKKQSALRLGAVVGAHALQKTLLQHLGAASVTLEHNVSSLAFCVSPDCWEVRYQTPQGSVQTATCQLLIAADGVASAFKAQQQISSQQYDYGHFALITNLQIKAYKACTAYERFLENGAIALLPWQDNLATCVWTTTEQEAKALMQLDDQAFIQQCQKVLSRRIGTIVALSKRQCVPLKMHIAKQQIGHRFVLMGNAAHTLHPIAAQGLNLSLRDIWQFKKLLNQQPNEYDIGDPYLLEQYQRLQASDQKRMIFATDKIAKYMSSALLLPGIRSLGLSLFELCTPIKNRFIDYAMGYR